MRKTDRIQQDRSTHRLMEKTDLNRRTRNDAGAPQSPTALLTLPAKKALDVILESVMPARLVQSFAEEDLFLFVHELGLEDSLPVLARASNEQWQYLLDLELWERDRLADDAVSRWLAVLLKAAPERTLTWILEENLELLELHLFRSIEVSIRQEDESPSDFADGFFSLDGVFYIRVRDNNQTEATKELLERLAALDVDTFHRLLLEVTQIIPGETEEELYRLRNVRLAEKGFVPHEEAMEIYQHLKAEMLVGKETTVSKALEGEETPTGQIVPASKALFLGHQGPFPSAVSQIKDWGVLERTQLEFAALCNRIMSADNRVARAKEDLASIVRKACAYLDTGLERLGGQSTTETVSFVEKFPLEQIFRVGYGAALEVKWKARAWVKKSWFMARDLDFGFWEDEWAGLLSGLLRPHPLFYQGFTGGEAPYREFRSMNEVAESNAALNRIMFLDHVLSLLFPTPGPICVSETYHPVTYKNLILTTWAGDCLGMAKKANPITVEQLMTFFRDLWVEGKKPYRISEVGRRSFFDWLERQSGSAVTDMGMLGKETLETLLAELEKEYGPVSVLELDPRFVKHFLVAVPQ